MKMKRGKARSGFTMIDLMAIIVGISILVMVLLPRNTGCKASATRITCTNNLKQIGLAYRQWAIDSGDKFPMQVSITNGGAMELIGQGSVYEVFLVMSNELNTPKLLICPDDRTAGRVSAATFGGPITASATYQPVPFTNNNNVSYFVGLDADEAKPQRFLSGDDNFLVDGVRPRSGLLLLRTNSSVTWIKERHISYGNIGLADGSVQGFTTPLVSRALLNTEIATNRLVLP